VENIEGLISKAARPASSVRPSLAAAIDIEVAEGLVARVRPTATRSTYEIQVRVLAGGCVRDESEPFVASFGSEFDRAFAALGA